MSGCGAHTKSRLLEWRAGRGGFPTVSNLDPWIGSCLGSGIEGFDTFAAGLRQDYAAVRAALSEPWSNGQAEDQINRLLVHKRQMYGRASFNLLRQRVLYRTA